MQIENPRAGGGCIYARDDLDQVWLIKIPAMQRSNQNVEARGALEDLLQKKLRSNLQAIHEAYQRADFLVRKEHWPDLYRLFAVSPNASLMEMKKQYWVKVMENLPEKWMSATMEELEKALHSFKLLLQRIEIFSDDFHWQGYDQG